MNTPKQLGFSMPAEWYPHERCWMAWPCHLETWEVIGLPAARLAYAQIAQAIAQFEPVTLLVNPEDAQNAAQLCDPAVQLKIQALDDSWTRDTGPSFLLNKDQQLAGVDWIHNAWGGNYASYAQDALIAKAIIEACEARYFHAPLIMEGGSFHVDGAGTVLTTRECLLHSNRNPSLSQYEIEQSLHQYLGTEKAIWLNQGLIGDETDGHVDEVACFINKGQVLCLITKDKSDPNYDRLQENHEILCTALDVEGNRLQVFCVEQPPATYLHQERLTLSYINFYRANQGIIMPAFGHQKYDEAAYQIFRQLFQRNDICQLNALNVFAGGGGIHCITQQQPKSVFRK